nr:hypothetical protein [Tanacetum cinerariifolium]
MFWCRKESNAYKTYLDFATGKVIPKEVRKRTKAYMKETSLTADDNIISEDPDVALELAKSISRIEATVTIRDTPTVTKKKTPKQSLKLKGMEMLSDAPILAVDTKKAIKANKRDFRSQHQIGGSSEGVGSKPEVLDESKGKTKDINEGASSKPKVPDVSKAITSDQESKNESWGKSKDDDDDDHKNAEEYVRINEELYGDVNVEMKEAEPADKEKVDEEMTDAKKVETEHKEINQEVASSTRNSKTQSSLLLIVPVSVILEPTVLSLIPKIASPATTIPPPIPSFIPQSKQSTPIPTPKTTKATTLTPTVSDSETLFAIHLRISDLEKEVKELKIVDHSTSLLATIKYKVLMAVKEYLGTSLGDALHKVEDTVIEAEDTDMPLNQRDDMGGADEQPDNEAALKQDWFKKSARPPTPNLVWNTRKSVDDGPEQSWLNNLANAKRPPLTFDDLMSTFIDFSAVAMNHLQVSNLTKADLVRPIYNLLKGTCKSYVELEYNMEECYRALSDQLEWNNPEGNQYQKLYKFMEGDFPRLHLNDIKDMLLLVDQNKLNNLDDNVIVHLTLGLHMYTRRIVIQSRVEDLQLGVEDYQKKLNISKPRTRDVDLSCRYPYTILSDRQQVIYKYKLKKKRFIRTKELYKFSDSTHTLVRNTLHQMLKNLMLGYNKVMNRRKWIITNQKHTHIMVKDIDKQLLHTRIMRSLEKFVGGSDYGTDYRLLKRIV